MSDAPVPTTPVSATTAEPAAASAPVGGPLTAPPGSPPVPPSAFARFRRNPTVRAACVVLALVLLAAIFVPLLLPKSASATSDLTLAPPSAAHLIGTDLNGRDLLYRLFIGARISLAIGLLGALVSLFVGTSYGLVSGYVGGRVDALMMRIVDVIYSIPRLILLIILISIIERRFQGWLQGVFGGSPLPLLRTFPSYSKTIILILFLGMIEWLTMARIVRGQVLSLKNLQFITAARSLGQSHFKILTRHLLPNLTGIIAVYLTLTIPAVILDESFLSYLGLGVDASQASWGTLLSDGGTQAVNPIQSHWWMLVFPGLLMSLTLLALNFLGDGLRDALDPRSKQT